jgi:hypothetical protein
MNSGWISRLFLPSSKSNLKIDVNQITFHVGSLGSVRLLDPINLGLSLGKTTIAATPETSVGSSCEVNSPISIKPTKGSIVKELDEIIENLDLDESSDYSDMCFDENLNELNSYPEEDLMACYLAAARADVDHFWAKTSDTFCQCLSQACFNTSRWAWLADSPVLPINFLTVSIASALVGNGLTERGKKKGGKTPPHSRSAGKL